MKTKSVTYFTSTYFRCMLREMTTARGRNSPFVVLILACCMASRERSLALLLSGDELCAPDVEPVDACCSGLNSEPEASAPRSVSKSKIFLSRWSSQFLLERNCFTNLFSLCTSLSSSRLASSNEVCRAPWRGFTFAGEDDLNDQAGCHENGDVGMYSKTGNPSSSNLRRKFE